ncbi:si:ch211-191a24.3 [Lepisosteus oculatus]|uniref:si:ch211-191a24.3 n=1 Tax=Lepisosteus oculatus TaxID=7918 RepID=UPI003712B1EA
MEEGYELDLTYITECIIAVSFPRDCSEETYLSNLQDVTRMLKSKHADNYLVINLSEKRYELTKMNPKTMDTGWPDLHAPPLEKICTICKAMESWLNSDPQHVVVIHCRGGKSRIGVVISSYVHFTNISASADQALDRFAMKKFYDDKVSAIMTASQKRYVWFLNSLLTGSIKMNTSPLFLHFVILHGVPSFDTGGVCHPFLKVYQGMESVYTSGIYRVGAGYRSRICIALEPAQLLKGDVMIKCYHKRLHCAAREVVFRLQFHTGAVHGHRLVFDKEDLEVACEDDRFPDYGKIELMFSGSPEKVQGSELWQNGPGVTVDYNTADPLFRWDSLEHMSPDSEVPHSQGPVDGNLYAKVRKKSTTDSGLAGGPQDGSVTSSPDHSDHALSISSDSGHSTASVWTSCTSGTKRGPSKKERAELKRLLSGFGLDSAEPCREMTERKQLVGVQHTIPAQVHVNGDVRIKDRETDILDDEIPTHDLHSVDSIGTLSSSEGQHSNQLGHFGYHKSSQNSLLSDGFSSHTGEEQRLAGVPDLGISMEDYERVFNELKPGHLPQRNPSGSHVAPSKTQTFGQSGYSTQTWVQQQQMVAAQHYTYQPAESDTRFPPEKRQMSSHPSQTAIPDTPTRGSSSRDAVQRATIALKESNGLHIASKEEDSPASLAMDIDQSIEQLNQLIMDLDPTFVPIPTRSNSVKREGTGQVNGSVAKKDDGARFTYGVNRRIQDGNNEDMQNTHQSALQASDSSLERSRSVLGARQSSDITESSLFSRTGWVLMEQIQHSPAYASSSQPSECSALQRREVNGEAESSVLSSLETGSEIVPPTPAFPVSPPTPYVRNAPEFTEMRMHNPASRDFEAYRPSHEPRGYMDNITHTTMSSEGDLFRSDVTVTASSCQRPYVSTNSPLPQTESPSPPGRSWQDGNPKVPLSVRTSLPGASRSSPHCLGSREFSVGPSQGPSLLSQYPGSHASASCHSSPRGLQAGSLASSQAAKGPFSYGGSVGAAQRFQDQDDPSFSSFPGAADSLGSRNVDLSSLLDNGSLEHSFLTAVEGLSQPSPAFRHAGVNVQPPLPEKKRISEGEHSIGSASPSLSGFSSPHSGSTISIPFPSVLPDFSQVLSTSPIPDAIPNKQVTVKFVQDTSKFWYKPDISRDQAIAILKDKEPGSFIVRDSHSFRGAYGLAMKVATPPPSVLQQSKKVGDLSNELVRHFLIECTQKGVRLKGCPNEPYFGSLTALVCQHSITPLALPCKLIIPDRDPLEDIGESNAHMATNSAAELLKQGAACNVWYLGSVEMESLTGTQAVHKATSVTLNPDTPTTSTVVHFKVSAQGITLTDNQRKLFFRRHYAVNTVIFCALDPQDRRWTKDGCSSAKIFGFVARKQGSATDNVCHLFAEHDPQQPASAIVNFVSRVMIGSQKSK